MQSTRLSRNEAHTSRVASVAVVHHNDLDFAVRLFERAGDGLAQVLGLVEGRNDDADQQGCALSRRGLPRLSLANRRAVHDAQAQQRANALDLCGADGRSSGQNQQLTYDTLRMRQVHPGAGVQSSVGASMRPQPREK